MLLYMRTTNTTHSFNRSANKVQKPREAKTKNKKKQKPSEANGQKPKANGQKPTAKSQKPTAKAKSQKPRGHEILAPKCSK